MKKVYAVAIDVNKIGQVCTAISEVNDVQDENIRVIKGKTARDIWHLLRGTTISEEIEERNKSIWIDVNKELPKRIGMYQVVLLPDKDLKKCNEKLIKAWIKKYGATIAYFNGRFYDGLPFSLNTKDITKRVIFWMELPKLPEITKDVLKGRPTK